LEGGSYEFRQGAQDFGSYLLGADRRVIFDARAKAIWWRGFGAQARVNYLTATPS
jgi:hypothetical protein